MATPFSTSPFFYDTPQTIPSDNRSPYARPPILKRAAVPQKSWRPQVKRKTKNGPLTPLPRITFDLAGAPPSYGLPIALLTSQGCQQSVQDMVQGGREVILQGLDKVVFRILWPGYDHVDWHRHVRLTTSTGPITRGQLAEQIIDHLFSFFHKLASETVDPNEKVWTIGHNTRARQWGMENVILLGLYPVHERTYQAELQVCLPDEAQVDNRDGARGS
ncbi:hypothetical protein BXZ70DRAFT_649039 [Cristinia sonorae]|uniref:Uncharacterized protein n=1 Tax=Cristinia sonorae TaxID=1940300 RepID=A0A8K0UGC0_9AGAR|nr:hypothetical protein BXZ70DRAFT_649039 [Cristinia sonorae]